MRLDAAEPYRAGSDRHAGGLSSPSARREAAGMAEHAEDNSSAPPSKGVRNALKACG